jgi:hypothetical protein
MTRWYIAFFPNMNLMFHFWNVHIGATFANQEKNNPTKEQKTKPGYKLWPRKPAVSQYETQLVIFLDKSSPSQQEVFRFSFY